MQNKRLEMKKTKGSIMLLFAAFFWGTTPCTTAYASVPTRKKSLRIFGVVVLDILVVFGLIVVMAIRQSFFPNL